MKNYLHVDIDDTRSYSYFWYDNEHDFLRLYGWRFKNQGTKRLIKWLASAEPGQQYIFHGHLFVRLVDPY